MIEFADLIISAITSQLLVTRKAGGVLVRNVRVLPSSISVNHFTKRSIGSSPAIISISVDGRSVGIRSITLGLQYAQ